MWLLLLSGALAGPCDRAAVLARTPIPAGEQSLIELSELELAAVQWTLSLHYGKDRERRTPVIKRAELTADYLVENGRGDAAWAMGLPLREPRVITQVAGVDPMLEQALDPTRHDVAWHACEDPEARAGTSFLTELPTGPTRIRVVHRIEADTCTLHLLQNPAWAPRTTQLEVEHHGPRRATLQIEPGARAEDGVHRWEGAKEVTVTLEGC